jgi:hypothetical protein
MNNLEKLATLGTQDNYWILNKFKINLLTYKLYLTIKCQGYIRKKDISLYTTD